MYDIILCISFEINRFNPFSTRAVFTNSPCSGTESLRKCFCGMPPFYAHIRKDGANFAQIDCYSTGDDFSVEPMHPLFEEPEWIVHFLKSDINSIPLKKLLELLPI